MAFRLDRRKSSLAVFDTESLQHGLGCRMAEVEAGEATSKAARHPYRHTDWCKLQLDLPN